MAQKKGRTKKSAIKTFGNAYVRSGDVFGKQGIRDLEVHKTRVSMSSYSDNESLAHDWIDIGSDIEKSMLKFKEEEKI
ncbi:hypothetical protein [Salinicoccus sp. CNSTN-B1]